MTCKDWEARGFIIVMLAVPLTSFAVFWLYVNFDSILMAFQNEKSGQVYWTLQNFRELFKEFGNSSSEIFISLKNTLYYFLVNLFVVMPLSLILCYFLYKKIYLYKAFRFIFYLPSIISAAVLVVLVKYLLEPAGPLGGLASNLLGEEVFLLKDSRYATNTIILYTIFTGLGGNMILLSGAMSHIDQSIIEAAKLDGISRTREMVQIVIPLIWPTLTTLLIFTFVGLFGASGPIILFTDGEVDTSTLSYWLYISVQKYNASYYPAAVGLFFTCVGTPIALFVRRVLNKTLETVEM